jgi:hypothetical protein
VERGVISPKYLMMTPVGPVLEEVSCSRLKAQRHNMRLLLAFILSWSMAVAASSLKPLWAQDLSPRAYVITAVHSNAINVTYSFFHGSILLDGAAPVTGATGTYEHTACRFFPTIIPLAYWAARPT